MNTNHSPSEEIVIKFLTLLMGADEYLSSVDDKTHLDIVELANKNGYDFNEDDLKKISKELFDSDDGRLSRWFKDRMKLRYLSYWID